MLRKMGRWFCGHLGIEGTEVYGHGNSSHGGQVTPRLILRRNPYPCHNLCFRESFWELSPEGMKGRVGCWRISHKRS